MILALSVAALMATSPSIPSQIDIADADWNAYPRLETADIAVPNGEMVTQVQRLMQRDVCEFPGQLARRFSIDVNYGVMLDAQGNATQIIVEDVGCRPLELLVGRIAAQIVREGHVRTTPPREPSWYASRINFNLH